MKEIKIERLVLAIIFWIHSFFTLFLVIHYNLLKNPWRNYYIYLIVLLIFIVCGIFYLVLFLKPKYLIDKKSQYFVGFFSYLLVIFLLSSGKHSQIEVEGPDYIFHSIEFLVLTILVFSVFNGSLIRGFPLKKVIITIFFILIYAISDEFHQSFVPGRTASKIDVLYDEIGAILGMSIIYLFQKTISFFVINNISTQDKSFKIK
jgi:VanZ family protein